jgi:hypothetical protein
MSPVQRQPDVAQWSSPVGKAKTKTGIAFCLTNSGLIEHARQMAD